MYKIRIHIENDNWTYCDQVYVDISLPFVPSIGDIIYLSKKDKKILTKRLILAKNTDLGSFYYREYIMPEKNIDYFYFEDCRIVKEICYNSGSEIIHISTTTTN
jgi:hypothetical protein